MQTDELLDYNYLMTMPHGDRYVQYDRHMPHLPHMPHFGSVFTQLS